MKNGERITSALTTNQIANATLQRGEDSALAITLLLDDLADKNAALDIELLEVTINHSVGGQAPSAKNSPCIFNVLPGEISKPDRARCKYLQRALVLPQKAAHTLADSYASTELLSTDTTPPFSGGDVDCRLCSARAFVR